MNELGEWLAQAREARGLTLHDAERDTRISRRYLQALESGELDVIPAPVYARGFLRSYAQYLGLDPQEAMARYPRADDGANVGTTSSPAQRQPQKPQQQRGRPPAPRESQPVIGANPPTTANRPAWRRPGPAASAEHAEALAPGASEEASPAVRTTRPVPMPRNESFAEEPMIGVDIGVPVPARKLQQDPAAQTRSMAVLIVAVVVIAAILFLAFAISRLGGSDNPTPTPPTSSANDSGAGATNGGEAETPAPSLGGSGLVPDVEGLSEDAARREIQAAGLVPNVIYEPTDAISPGVVLTQSPGPGVQRSPGDPMTIVVSEAP